MDGFGDKTGGNFLIASAFHNFSRTLLQGFTFIIIIIIIMGPEWRSRYSDSLWALRSGDGVPVGG